MLWYVKLCCMMSCNIVMIILCSILFTSVLFCCFALHHIMSCYILFGPILSYSILFYSILFYSILIVFFSVRCYSLTWWEKGPCLSSLQEADFVERLRSAASARLGFVPYTWSQTMVMNGSNHTKTNNNKTYNDNCKKTPTNYIPLRCFYEESGSLNVSDVLVRSP